MPRRASASVGPSVVSTPNSSTILVHRTTESHHAFSTPSQNQSLQTLGASVTPQQKIVQVLVNRLRQKVWEWCCFQCGFFWIADFFGMGFIEK